jgi:hypothetical protein
MFSYIAHCSLSTVPCTVTIGIKNLKLRQFEYFSLSNLTFVNDGCTNELDEAKISNSGL